MIFAMWVAENMQIAAIASASLWAETSWGMNSGNWLTADHENTKQQRNKLDRLAPPPAIAQVKYRHFLSEHTRLRRTRTHAKHL
tara:strand:- start:437 stop:688 length:252 start_codon:yes stop_codon:yes gene_type:complete